VTSLEMPFEFQRLTSKQTPTFASFQPIADAARAQVKTRNVRATQSAIFEAKFQEKNEDF
jgi:hypothetical protein